MVYGETGRTPVRSIINTRMISFWNRISSGKETKYSFILLSLITHFNDDISNTFQSAWLTSIRDTLSKCGLGFIWLNRCNVNNKALNKIIDVHFSDVTKQKWVSEVTHNSCCTNYSIFKSDLVFEKYLIQLNYNDRIVLCKFRCGNIRFPSNCRRFSREESRGGGHSNGKRGIRLVHGLTKSTLITYYSGMKKRP